MRKNNFTTRGLGFIRPKSHLNNACYKIIEVEAETSSGEGYNFFEVNLTNDEEVEAKPTPKELKDGRQTTIIDSLKKSI